MGAFRLTDPEEVRAAIAHHLLGESGSAAVGEIVLHSHQLLAVERLRRMLSDSGGALLADDVGLGKTYVALAIARHARTPVIVSPAALRSTWEAALTRTGIQARWFSVESLSYAAPRDRGDFVIIDEAHHLRNASTRRFAAAATLCQDSTVLLLSATPVQNRIDDLRTLLSLFLGSRAHAMTDAELAAHCIRRSADDVPASLLRLPTVQEPVWLPPVIDADCLDRILALPPPVLPLGASDGGVLTTYTLVRQWSSSRAALRQALLRRIAKGMALEAALLAGRLPTSSELNAWVCAETDLQLAFPELVVNASVPEPAALVEQVRAHVDGVRSIIAWLDASPDPDIERARTLRDLTQQSAGARVVAFSEHGDTISRLYGLLAPDVRCAMITHTGGRVAGGRITRRELLRRFDPAQVADVAASDRIDLLLTTDVFSEGVSLHAASVVVHLDLAWNPARLAQRVGRLRRIGAAHASVRVLLFPPPASAERLLRLNHVLRFKLGIADASVGLSGGVLPELKSTTRSTPLQSGEQIASRLTRWRQAQGPEVPGPVAAAVRVSGSPYRALACVDMRRGVMLLSIDEAMRVSDDRRIVQDLLPLAESPATRLTEGDLVPMAEAVHRWMLERSASEIVAVPSLSAARSRRAVLRRVNAIVRRSSRPTQAAWAPLISAARSVATAPLTAGTEQLLADLAAESLDDHDWLQSVSTVAQRSTPARNDAGILALLLLRS